MKQKLVSCVVLLFWLSSALFARDVNTARRQANAFQNQQVSARHLAPASPMQLVAQAKQDDDSPAYFIFNGAQNFVVIAGDDRLPAVIGYSDQGAFDPNNIPPDMQWWMDELQYPEPVSESSQADRPHYKLQQNLPDSVLPLLGSLVWNQSAPYNNLTPDVNGESTPIGCLATAVAQVLKYHEYPDVGTGVSLTYTTYSHNISQTSNFNVPYDWDNMLDDYSGFGTFTERNAVAHLMIDVAILCHMDFDPSGSGAYASTAREGLQKYLGYDDDIRGVSRSTLSYEEWENLLKNELVHNGPFFFSAYSGSGGHAFVCDGYNTDNLFHINWGWGGMSNGYFLLSGMNPNSQGIGGSDGGYFYGIEATIGIKPKNTTVAEDYNMVSLDRIDLPHHSFQSTATQDISLLGLMNTMGETYRGDLALMLYKKSTNRFVKQLGNTGYFTLNESYYSEDVSVEGDFSGLSDGDYYFSPVLLPKNTTDTIVLAPRYPGAQIPVSILGTQVTIEIPKFAVTGAGIHVMAPSDTAIYASSPVELSFKLKAGSKLYNGMYALKLVSSTGFKRSLESSMLMVRANDSLTVTTTFDCPYMSVGDYTIQVYLDTLYRLDKPDFDEAFVSVDTLPIKVLAQPEESNVQLSGPIYCNNVRTGFVSSTDSIYRRDAYVHVPLINKGGYGASSVVCIIWNGSTLVTYTIQAVILATNETQELVFDMTKAMSLDKSYTFEVRKINSDYETEAFSNANYYAVTYYVSSADGQTAMAVDETPVSPLNYFNHTLYNTTHEALKIYSISGLLVYQGTAVELNLESWDPGVYVVKTADEVLKVMR